MRRDFTIETYEKLLQALQRAGYATLTVREGLQAMRKALPGCRVLLRHDVDRRPDRAEAMASLERAHGVRSTYYFRICNCSFDVARMRAIERMGHEVGYHYEDLAEAGGDLERARESFVNNLRRMRSVVKVDTACMHGSPTSKHDNRLLFKVLTFREVGLLGEPYISWANSGLAYLTDTGRCWDATSTNVRDRLEGSDSLRFRSTFRICTAIVNNEFPREVMLTTHPQRWVDSFGSWCWEITAQNAKNLAKRFQGVPSDADRVRL